MSSHGIKGRQLSVDTEHRKAIRRNLVQSLFEHGQIKTTYPKAKEVRGLAEKLITLAKTNTDFSRRRALAILNDRRLVDNKQEFTGQSVLDKLFVEIGPKFAGRTGGYTRVIKTAKYRIGDAASLVILQLVSEGQGPSGAARKAAGLRRKRAEKKGAFASKALKKGETKAESKPEGETKPSEGETKA
jgi:large subunit ribosomal protein L17